MKNIKDFQARYNRWKNGERYWDIRGIDLPRYDDGDKQTYIFQKDDGQYYAAPTNSSFTQNVTPVLQRNLADASTWDFKGDDGTKYTTQWTDDQLKDYAMRQQSYGEFYTWTDLKGERHRDPRVIGMSPVDPVGQFAVEGVALSPLIKPLGYVGNNLLEGIAKDFRFTRPGNWLSNKFISHKLNNVIDNTYKRFPVYNPSIFANSFIPKRNGFGEIELIPIANSQFDNYARNIYTKLNKPVEYPEIRLIVADRFSPGVNGLYNYTTKVASISQEEADLLSTAIHEAISHHTDPYVENLPIRNFIPDVNINATVGDVYRALGQQGSRFHELPSSSKWNEVRATLNELRGNSLLSKTNIDDVYNDEILTALRDVNAYGQDYYNALMKSSPQNNNNWFDLFKTAWKYLPAATPPLINSTNEKGK